MWRCFTVVSFLIKYSRPVVVHSAKHLSAAHRAVKTTDGKLSLIASALQEWFRCHFLATAWINIKACCGITNISMTWFYFNLLLKKENINSIGGTSSCSCVSVIFIRENIRSSSDVLNCRANYRAICCWGKQESVSLSQGSLDFNASTS